MLEKTNRLSVNCTIQTDQQALMQCGAVDVCDCTLAFQPAGRELLQDVECPLLKRFSRGQMTCVAPGAVM